MSKRNILWPLAIISILGSAQVKALNVSFGFATTLTWTVCDGFFLCDTDQIPELCSSP